MLLFLLLATSPTNNLGIGLGTYPNGLFSLKFQPSEAMAFQVTLGTSPWIYNKKGEWSVPITIGGRFRFLVGDGGDGYYFQHVMGAGMGVHLCGGSMLVIPEGFYTFEIFPNPDELPFSFEIGLGLIAVCSSVSPDIRACVAVGVHYYVK
jgi:hypothetical protein